MDSGCAFWLADQRKRVRLLVSGGREFCDRSAVFRALDTVMDRRFIVAIAHRGAGGADALGGEWARTRGVDEVVGPIHWSEIDGVVAFPGDRESVATIAAAIEAGVPVWQP